MDQGGDFVNLLKNTKSMSGFTVFHQADSSKKERGFL
jgi:hypothetical protein